MIAFVLEIFAPNLIPVFVTVGCLIPGFIILLFYLLTIVGDFIETRKLYIKLYDIISLIIIVGLFIKGFSSPYHSIQYHYEYVGIFSALATTVWPTVGLLLIKLIIKDDFEFGEKISGIISLVGMVLTLFAVAIFLSALFAFFYLIGGHSDVSSKIVKYSNEKIVESKKDWKYNDEGECLEAELPQKIKEYMESQMVNSTDRESSLTENIKYYYPNGNMCHASDQAGKLTIDDRTVYYFFKDKETNKKEYYYKFDYNTFTIEKITKKEYDSHR